MSQSPSDFELNLNQSTVNPAESSDTDFIDTSDTATESTLSASVAQSQTAPQVNKIDQQRARASRLMQAVRDELEKALIGQTDIVNGVLCTLIASGHVLIEGVPGLGKTLLVRAIAQCFSGQFNRIQFTPDLMPSDVTGARHLRSAK